MTDAGVGQRDREGVPLEPRSLPPRADLAWLATLLFVVALAARWSSADGRAAATFRPRPDALEYVASAQAIADEGRYHLQVGPHRVRPRYPPGWPSILALALKVGVAPQQLWRVTGLFGAALAAVLGVAAAAAAWRLGLGGQRERRLAARLAGVVAGATWALGRLPVRLGGTLLSDEPAALFATLALLLSGWALLTADRSGRLAGAAVGAGACIAVAVALRTSSGAVLAPPLALIAVAAAQRRTLGWRRVLAVLAGAVLPVAFVVLLLLRSGEVPWRWSGYDLWLPDRFGTRAGAFALRHAWEPDHVFRAGSGNLAVSHLGHGTRVLLGIPGLRRGSYVGRWWPLLAWVLAGALALRRQGARDELRIVVGVAAAWALAHLALFSVYFYPASRFYAGPLAASCLLAGLVVAALLGNGRRSRRALATSAAALVLVVTILEPAAGDGRAGDRRARARRVEREVSQWLRQSDAERRARTVRFDPLVAQALGLLGRDRLAGVGEWGRLPRTPQVLRLWALGEIATAELAPAPRGRPRRRARPAR